MAESNNGQDPFREFINQMQERENRNLVPSDAGNGTTSSGNDATIDEDPPRSGRMGLYWIGLAFLVVMLGSRLLTYYTDWLWFDSLDFTSVYFTRILASGLTFLVGAVVFWLILAGNIALATRLNNQGGTSPLDSLATATLGFRVTPVLQAGAVVLAIFSGLALRFQWNELLLFLNQVEFGVLDPIFQRDVSFFVFSLPILKAIRSFLLTALVFSLIGTVLVSGLDWKSWFEKRSVKSHLSLLLAGILVLIAWQYQLQSYELVYSTRGAVLGGGYTDVYTQLPIFRIMAVVTLVIAVLVIVNIFLSMALKAIAYVLGLWILVALVLGNFLPNIVQRFVVTPNEFTREEPFIQHNIDFTRLAFDLNDLDSVAYNARGTLTGDDLMDENETITNIRLWDYRPMLTTYNQIQALRQYYQFQDIDIDRYVVDGKQKQVLLSARELVPDQLSGEAQTWVNQRLVYTHGYGAAASPVAEITFDGLPTFLLQDLPPKGSIPIERPQIYFSEVSRDYVIVNTLTQEFDYPSEEGNVFTRFEGDSGIRIGNLLTRLAFTVRFADINLLLTGDITPDSKLLWKRNIHERLEEVAPFLQYDDDPYIVIGEDGGLYWFVDAYTYSRLFPYSQIATLGNGLSVNYIRNSVKVVVNAYDGSVKFYIVDREDPIAAAYAAVFPGLFHDIGEMPEGLRAHIRYPQDLFTIQARVLTIYHMTKPSEFYNREDVWQWPQEFFDDKPREMEPYYVLMQLPGSEKLDFIQILPFTPATRENMIAWLAAKSDPAEYGEKLLFTFGKDSLVYGPKQIEARIDQDPVISSQLSLWNQQGSQVIRGNLLVIPLGNSLLYVEPLYLQAASGRIPELKRVIVAANDRVVMAPNLGLALVEVFGGDLLEDELLASLLGDYESDALVTSAPADVPAAGPPAAAAPLVAVDVDLANSDTALLIQQANSTYGTAIQAQRDGDWAAYGQALTQLEAILRELEARVTGAEE